MKTYFKMNDNQGIIRPDGWIKTFLEKQLNGLTGNIEKAGYPFDSISWCHYDEDSLRFYGDVWKWVPFEQTGYYVDGATKLATLLGDKKLMKKVDNVIYPTFANVASDGFIGPEFLRPSTVNNRWPYTVFFRAVIARYYANHDKELINKIENHYLNSQCDYSKTRNVTNIETMLMVYEITRNPKLLELAKKTYSDYHNDLNKDASACSHYTLDREMLDDIAPYEHGVTYNEVCKLGAILYGYTGNKNYLKPVIKAYKKIEKYHMQADGLHSCNEFFRGKSPSESHETCDVSDYTWSLGYLLKATGNGHYADLIEKCIYNAGIGSVLEDFKGLQYFSSVNQIILDSHSNHCFYRYGKNWMSYLPTHETQCCAGNVNRFFPNFVSKMYMKKNKNIYLVFFGNSEFETKINGKKIIVNQTTNYPFDEKINIAINGSYLKTFNLVIRIPAWCRNAKITLNGIQQSLKISKGFVTLKDIKINDKILIDLPQESTVSAYGKNGVIINRGPILYSLGMKGKRYPFNNDSIKNEDYPGYNIYSDKKWNYGLKLDATDLKFIESPSNSDDIWNLENIPYAIEVSAYRLDEWKEVSKKSIISTDHEDQSVKNKMTGEFTFTPKIKQFNAPNNTNIERILLYPYGACKIRIGVFPKVK